MLNKYLKKYFSCLDRLQQTIFNFYIQRNFGADRFYHEKQLLKHTTQVMKALAEIRKRQDDAKLLAVLEQLYEIIYSLDLLKNRLIDHTTFEICEQELKNIKLNLSQILQKIPTQKLTKLKHQLDQAIQALEIIFQNTLQVVTADPLVFLFFIQDLYALANTLDHFQTLSML